MSLEQAFVEISPQLDPGDFTRSIDEAMGVVESRADEAVGSLEQSFETGSEQAAESLDAVTSDFDGVTEGAESASSMVEEVFGQAASEAEAALGTVDGDGFTDAVSDAESAGDEIGEAFEDAAESATSALSETEGDFSGLGEDATAAGDEIISAFEDAAGSSSDALEGVDADFSDAVGAADDAASEISSSLGDIDPDFSDAVEAASDAASDIDEALSDVDPDLSNVVDAVEDAAEDAGNAFDGVAGDIEDELSSAGDSSSSIFSGIADDAQVSAGATGGSFFGVGAVISGEMEEGEEGANNLEASIRNLLITVAGFAALRAAVQQVEALKTEMGLLELQLDNTDVEIGTTVEQLGRLAEEASIEFGINVDELVLAQRRVASFADDTGQSFDDLLDTSIDLSAAMGVSVPDAARILGQAMEDPAAAFTRLERRGVFLDSQQRQLIESMSEAGDTAGASALFFETLSGQVDGAAGVAADSSQRIGQAFMGLVREIGGPVSDTLDANVETIIGIIESIEPAATTIGEAAGIGLQVFVELGPAIEAVATVIGNLPPELLATATGFAAANRAARGLNAALNLMRAHPAIAALSAVAAGLALINSIGSDTAAEVHEVDRALLEIADSGGAAADELLGRLDDKINDVDDSMKFLFIRATSDPFSSFVDQGGNLETVLEDINEGIVRLAATDLEAAEEAFAAVQQRVAEAGDEVQDMAEDKLAEAEFALERARAEAEETSEAIQNFGQSTEEAGRALSEFDISRTGEDFIAFAEILQESESQVDDFEAAAARLGVSVETLENAVPGVQAQFESFTGTLESSIPGVEEVVSRSFDRMTERHNHFFEELGEMEVGSEDWVTQVLKMAGQDEEFGASLQRIAEDHGSLKEALQDPELADEFVGEIQRMNEAGGELDLSDVSASIFGVEQDAAAFVENMQVIVDSGFTGLAELAAQSPEIAAVIAANITDEEQLGEMEAGMQAINDLTRNAMLTMAAEQALVSHAVGEAIRTGTLEPLNLLPEDIRSQVMPTVSEAIRSGQEAAGNAGGAVGESGSSSFLENFLSGVRSNTPNMVETAAGAVQSTIGPSTLVAQQGGSGVGQTLVDAEGNAIQQGQGEVQSEMVGVNQAVIDAGQRAAQNATVIGAVITARFALGMQLTRFTVALSAGQVGQTAIQAASRSVRGAVAAGAAFDVAFAAGISIALWRVAVAGASAGRAAVNGAAGQTGGAYSIGLQISGGIASGISAGVGSIIAAAVYAVRAALNAARAAARTGSPSREFHDEIGLPISQGIAGGIQDGIGEVMAATREVIDAAAGTAVAVPRPDRAVDMGRGDSLSTGDVDRLADAIAARQPDTIVLASGSERALARMTRKGDRDLEQLDSNWRRDNGR